MKDQKNDPTLDPTLAVSISTFPLAPYYIEKNISDEYIKKEEYNKSSDNILNELGNVALIFSFVLLFLMLLYLALCFSKK